MTEFSTIYLNERQHERFERIKEECTEGGHAPKPSDGAMLDSLMDTWDAVGDGHYSDNDTFGEREGDDGA